MVARREDAWPSWFYIVGIVLVAINILACVGVIVKIARRRRGLGGAAAARANAGMARLIDDLMLLLATYDLMYEIVFSLLCYVAYLLPVDSPLGSKAFELFVYGIPFSWPPFFLHTYIASVCYSWLVLGHSIPRIRRGFGRAMCWIFVAFSVQAFFEVIVFLVDKWIPFYTIKKWARFAAYERMAVMIVTTGITAYFYLRTCWTILVRFKARERVKRRHQGIVRKFVAIMTIVIVTNALWTTYLYMWYRNEHGGPNVTIGALLIYPSLLVPFYDAVVLGNLFQGWCQPCGASKAPAAAVADGDDRLPEQPPALGGRQRPASRNFSSVKYLNSFLGGKANGSYRSGVRGGSSLVANPASLFVTTFNMGPIKDVRGLGGAGALGEWVPLGYDVYAIGLQECNCVEELRQALHAHLGGAAAYQMFQSEVAPATLLYGSIALTVFARAADVASGAFAAVGAETSAVRNGVNLVVGKAGNKGMTGLSFRCFDATLAFVTCHYASDSGGKKRLRQRNLDARRTLRDIRLTDDEGFHVAAQHHHTFIFGDMNYRMRLSADEMVKRVAATARALQSSVWQEDSAGDIEEVEDGGGGGGSDDLPQDEESGAASSSATPEPIMSPPGPRSWVAEAYAKLFRPGFQSPVHSVTAERGGGVGGGGSRVSFLAGPTEMTSATSVTSSALSVSVLKPPQEEEEEGGGGGGASGVGKEGEEDEEEEDDEEAARGSDDETAGPEQEGALGGGGEPPAPPPNDGAFSTITQASGLGAAGAQGSRGVWFGHLFRWFSGNLSTLSDPDGARTNSSADVFSSYSSTTSDAFTSYTAKSTCESLWSWVVVHDELLQEMRAGHVFAGFSEGPITFPPPFRWRKGGHAGNFTSEERLRGAYVLRKKGDGERIPSYTDRILFHSLPDVRHQLQLLAYQMCDGLRGSDHRPVSAAFNLAVNRERIGFHVMAAGLSPMVVTPELPLGLAATASTWHVQLSKASYRGYRLRPSLATASDSAAAASSLATSSARPFALKRGRASSFQSFAANPSQVSILPQPDWRVTIFFPCVLEDPFAEEIKVHALEEALGENTAALVARGGSPSGNTSVDDGSASQASKSGLGRGRGGGGGGGGSSGGADVESLRRSRAFTWQELRRSEGAAFSVLVQPEVSRHALLRLSDARGAEVAQGVICLRHAFLASSSSCTTNDSANDDGEGGKGGRGRGRFGLPLALMGVGARRGKESGEMEEGVEVLLTDAGRAVGSLRLQVKIRRHRN